MTECMKENKMRPSGVTESPQLSSAREPLNTVAAIPCFNTRPFIAEVISKAKQYVNHVIVIDDGSQDGTGEVARAAGATVIVHEHNRGYGSAIKSCLEAARTGSADALVILDGDGQHDPHDIPGVLAPVVRGEADLVIGSRFITNHHNMPPYRRFGIGLITFLWNVGAKVQVSDTQSGFRAYAAWLIRDLHLTENGMASSIEILEKARRHNAVVREVPVSCSYVPSSLNRRALSHGLGVALAVIRRRLAGRL